MCQFLTRFLPTSLREKIAGHGFAQTVIHNTSWQFADNIVRMGIGLLVGIWLARYLGPEQFGLFSYALSFVGLFAALSNLGLDDIIVREIVRDSDNENEILGTTFLLRLCGGLLTFVAATGTLFILRPDDSLSHWLVGIIAAGAIFQAFNVIEFWFYSQLQAKYAVIAKNTAFLFCSLLKVALLLFQASLLFFAWVALLEITLGSFGLVMVYRQQRAGRLCAWSSSLKRAVLLLQDSWPLMLSSLVIMVYLRIDQVMLGEMVGHEEVGIYAVAVRLAEVWYFIPAALYWSFFPGIVAAKNESSPLFYARLQQLYNFSAFFAYLIAVPTLLIAQWLVPFLFGEAYARGGLMLAVLIWANLFTSLEMARSGFLTAMNWTRLYLLTVVLGCTLNIILNSLLIPQYGGMGAAVASVAAYWLAAHGSCFLFKPLRKTGIMLTRALLWPKVW